MPPLVPTIEQIEDYLEAVEELIFSSLSAATPDLPNVRQAIQRLWEDVLRHGPQNLPSLPDLHIPGLGTFEVPPPPPPPPPPPSRSLLERSANWIGEHKWTTAIGISVIGVGLLAGYTTFRYQSQVKTRRMLKTSSASERRQVVVLIGGDSPLGLPLILELEKQGYIVITSVSTPEAADEVESHCHGFVRALVLDPTEPEMIPYFLRSLSSTMSRRFPITAAGDPHASPSSHPYIHSIVSLLTLPSSTTLPAPAPFERLSLQSDYMALLQSTHIVPLQVIQSLLPLLRTSSARARDSISSSQGKKSIIVCLPVTDARVGMPFASAQAMSAAASLRAVEVLRREIQVAAFTSESDAIKQIKVVVVDVGSVGSTNSSGETSGRITRSMDDWTPSEKLVYGPALTSLNVQTGVARKPTEVSVFVETLVDIVRGGRKNPGSSVFSIGLGLARLREWINGDRVVVGAGARTYGLASRLPAVILDGLLNLPHFLLSLRNALVPVQPRVPSGDRLPAASRALPPAPIEQQQPMNVNEESPVGSEQDHDVASETGSDPDVESNEGSLVGESWVSLREGMHSVEQV